MRRGSALALLLLTEAKATQNWKATVVHSLALELKSSLARRLCLMKEEYVWLDSVMLLLLLLLSLTLDSTLLDSMKQVIALRLSTAYRSLASLWDLVTMTATL